MSRIREQQIGLFDVIAYLMATIAIVGALAWSWSLIPVLVLIVATVPYATWREIQSLEKRNGSAPSNCEGGIGTSDLNPNLSESQDRNGGSQIGMKLMAGFEGK